MSHCTEVRHIKAARKEHPCTWCAEPIDAGAPYARYRWLGGYDTGTVRMHPECFDAMGDLASREGGQCEFGPGESSRGCCCVSDPST